MKPGTIAAVTGAVVLAGAVFAWNAVRQEREFRRLIATGDAALTQDQTYEAIEAFSGALALKRDSMLAYLKRGDSYRRRGEFSAALRDLRQASSLDPTATRPLELLGDVNVAMARYERAADAYRRYIALDDRAPDVLYKLALSYFRNGQPMLAIEPLRRALAIDGRIAEAHYLLAMCLEAQKNETEAVRSLGRALQINPALAVAREELARLDLARGRTRDAVEQLEALAALEPSRPERFVDVALTYARAGAYDDAIATLGRATQRYPEAQIVYVALGRVWLSLAEARHDRASVAKAIQVLEPVALRPDAPSETLTLYGRALLLTGQVELAERTLQRAASVLPVEPTAFLYLSNAAQRRGHASVARDALGRYDALIDEEQRRPIAASLDPVRRAARPQEN